MKEWKDGDNLGFYDIVDLLNQPMYFFLCKTNKLYLLSHFGSGNVTYSPKQLFLRTMFLLHSSIKAVRSQNLSACSHYKYMFSDLNKTLHTTWNLFFLFLVKFLNGEFLFSVPWFLSKHQLIESSSTFWNPLQICLLPHPSLLSSLINAHCLPLHSSTTAEGSLFLFKANL